MNIKKTQKINICNCRGNREMVNKACSPDFYIGRPSPLGNPYSVEQFGRDKCIEMYKPWLEKRLANKQSEQYFIIQHMKKALIDFGFVNLWCWCEPLPCHGKIIKEVLLHGDRGNDKQRQMGEGARRRER